MFITGHFNNISRKFYRKVIGILNSKYKYINTKNTKYKNRSKTFQYTYTDKFTLQEKIQRQKEEFLKFFDNQKDKKTAKKPLLTLGQRGWVRGGISPLNQRRGGV